MAQFTINAQRFDPYKNFKFRVNTKKCKNIFQSCIQVIF